VQTITGQKFRGSHKFRLTPEPGSGVGAKQ